MKKYQILFILFITIFLFIPSSFADKKPEEQAVHKIIGELESKSIQRATRAFLQGANIKEVKKLYLDDLPEVAEVLGNYVQSNLEASTKKLLDVYSDTTSLVCKCSGETFTVKGGAAEKLRILIKVDKCELPCEDTDFAGRMMSLKEKQNALANVEAVEAGAMQFVSSKYNFVKKGKTQAEKNVAWEKMTKASIKKAEFNEMVKKAEEKKEKEKIFSKMVAEAKMKNEAEKEKERKKWREKIRRNKEVEKAKQSNLIARDESMNYNSDAYPSSQFQAYSSLSLSNASTVSRSPQDIENSNKIRIIYTANGYRSVTADIHNSTTDNIKINFAGAVLFQMNSTSQRIGLINFTIIVPAHGMRSINIPSRCLDRDRPPPKSGSRMYFYSKLVSGHILNALRSGMSQQDVWKITENKSITPYWKKSDPRGPALRTNRNYYPEYD